MKRVIFKDMSDEIILANQLDPNTYIIVGMERSIIKILYHFCECGSDISRFWWGDPFNFSGPGIHNRFLTFQEALQYQHKFGTGMLAFHRRHEFMEFLQFLKEHIGK